jgi:hypothetical protein
MNHNDLSLAETLCHGGEHALDDSLGLPPGTADCREDGINQIGARKKSGLS